MDRNVWMNRGSAKHFVEFVLADNQPAILCKIKYSEFQVLCKPKPASHSLCKNRISPQVGYG